MQNNVCKSCGGDIRREGNYYVCNFCGSRWTIDADSDVHVIDRANAWGALRDYDFERSVELFEYIIAKDPKNHEAYWGRALADAGIVYVTDLNESKKVPTCNNIRESSFLGSRDVEKAISLAPADIAESYKVQAQSIENIRTEWLKRASKEPPYDVFICFKDSDREHNLERTEDSYDAQELYYALTSKGYKVFFSRVSLRNKIAEHYEPYIYNAIKTAKVMIVFGEKPEYFSAVWVKNEWNRFRARIERGEKDKSSLVVAYKGMDPGDLPAGLRSRQCLNAADITFLDDLKNHIDKVIKAQTEKPQEKQPEPQQRPAAVVPPVQKKKKKGVIVAIAMILALCIGVGILIENLDRSGVDIELPEDMSSGNIGIFYPSGNVTVQLPGDYATEKGDKYPDDGWYVEDDYSDPPYEEEYPTEAPYPEETKPTDDDYNGNGIPDHLEKDNNGNGMPDYLDIDDNGNGIPDYLEKDNDGNGIVDYLEFDSNYNGVPDYQEGQGIPGVNVPGTDFDDENVIYSEGLEYELSLDGQSYVVVGMGSCTDTFLAIPPTYEGKPVTAIEADAFYNHTEILTVSIPASVTSIGECAFYGCNNIISMKIPFVGATKGGTENTHFGYIFGAYSYENNGQSTSQSLRAVTVFGDSDIADNAFANCHQLEKVYLTGNVARIGQYAFVNCGWLSYIYMNDSVVSVGQYAFSGCNFEYVEYENARYVSNNSGNDHFMLVEVIDKNVRNFKIHDDTVIIGGGAFSECRRLDSITLPESVTCIGRAAFEECIALQSVTFGSKLVEIQSRAFYDCAVLSELALPEGLEVIGSNAFESCASLINIVIPNSVSEIGERAFGVCSSLESITVPFVGSSRDATENKYFTYIFTGTDLWWQNGMSEKLKSVTITDEYYVPDEAFYYNCAWIETVTLPEGVESIGYQAFRSCTALKSINIPDSVQSIGDYAFAYCESLESFTMPKGVKTIGKYAFIQCTKITSLELSEELESIGKNAFENCSALVNINIPSGITSIESYTFAGCGFTEIIIPDTVESIGEYAFYNCEELLSVTIPNNIKSVGNYSFQDCTNVATLTVPFLSKAISDEETLYLNPTYLFYSTFGSLKTINVLGGDTVPDDAFADWYSVETIVLPDNVVSIGKRAFRNCESLKFVNIPDTVTDIGYGAFMWCYALESIEIPYGVTEIQSETFYNCKGLKTVIIPETVICFGDSVFTDCTSLEEITIPNLDFKDYDGNVQTGMFTALFSNGSSVPESIKKVTITTATELRAYAFSNCSHIEIIVLPETMTSISSNAFYNCYSLKSVNIPEGNTTIPSSLFYGCSELEYIDLPSTIKEISYGAFEGCSSLKSIEIPSGVEIIGQNAFYGCSSITSIVIPESVQTFGRGMLGDCQSLESITLAHVGAHADSSWDHGHFGYIFGAEEYFSNNNYVPRSLKTVIITHETELHSNAFADCEYIEEIILPDTLVTIGSSAFAECSALKSINIPSSVKEYPERMFNGCLSLESIIIEDGVTSIGAYAFNGCTGITELVIPESVESIGCGIVANCENLQSLTLPYMNSQKDEMGSYSNIGYFFGFSGYNGDGLYSAFTTVIITGGEAIKPYTFSNCYQITTVVLPSTVRIIDEYAFNDCPSLTTVYYAGSESDWQNINIFDIGNEALDSVNVICNASVTE